MELPFTTAKLLQVLPATDLFYHLGIIKNSQYGFLLEAAHGFGLTALDIASLKQVPRWVVLVGCREWGPGDDEDEELNPVSAFLAQGSEVVLAPTRVLSDETAAEVSLKLTRYSAAQNPPSFVAGWHQLQQELSQVSVIGIHKKDEWASFRLFVP